MQERNKIAELSLAIATVAVLAHFVDPAPAALIALLAVLATVAGAGEVMGERKPWLVPLLPVALPGVAAFAIAGISRLIDPLPALVALWALGWVTLYAVLSVELASDALVLTEDTPTERVRRRARPRDEFGIPKIVDEPVGPREPELAPHPRPALVRVMATGLALAAFVAAAGIVPGGFAQAHELQGEVGGRALVLYALVAGIAAGVVGYRTAGLISPFRVDRIVRVVALLQYGVTVGLAAGLIRSLALPMFFAPALLTELVYIISVLRDPTEQDGVTFELLRELALLTLAAVAVVIWGLWAR
jgi:hypothetical protein